MWQIVHKLILSILLLVNFTNGARILGVFPHPSHSHQVVFKALATELAKRGHELVVFTTYPAKNTKLENYTEVDMHYITDRFKKNIDFYKTGKEGVWTFLHAVYQYSGIISDETLSHPTMQRIISPNSTEKFDLILIQALYYDALYALSIRFNAPLIGISSLPLLAVHHHMLGNPPLLAYSPDAMLGYTDEMDIWERIVNVYYYCRQLYEYMTIILPMQEAVLRKHFGNDMPTVYELSDHMSLLFVNMHPFYHYPRANVPAVVQIGGCRSGRPKQNLPKKLKKILDDSKSGFIYFSLGSNLKSTQLPVETRNILLETFAELPYTVLWKFESDELNNKADNVIIQKWLPQQEILAHPKILLFMYQGGLQSTEEAIDNEVPLIGFPVFSDQIFNLNRLQKLGVARRLDLTKITKKLLKDTILEIAGNSSYKENVVKLSNLLRDVPNHPMEEAIWWTEHVIRHKGAPHIRSRSQKLPWYQSGLLDVTVVLLISFAIISYVSFIILRCILQRLVRLLQELEPSLASRSKKEE